jgi:hypothetical protein
MHLLSVAADFAGLASCISALMFIDGVRSFLISGMRDFWQRISLVSFHFGSFAVVMILHPLHLGQNAHGCGLLAHPQQAVAQLTGWPMHWHPLILGVV